MTMQFQTIQILAVKNFFCLSIALYSTNIFVSILTMVCFNLFNINKCNVLYGVAEKACDNAVAILSTVI